MTFSVCFLVLAVWVLIRVLKFGFVFVKYSHYAIYKKQARRGKLFGLFYKGEESARKQLVKQLIQGVKYEAQKLGLEYLIFEYGSKSPQAKYFPIHNFSMQVLQKALGKASVNEWSAESFIDPREWLLNWFIVNSSNKLVTVALSGSESYNAFVSSDS